MVMQTESTEKTTWFSKGMWTRALQPGGALEHSGKGCAVYPDHIGSIPDKSRSWKAFESADALELGLGPGLASTYIDPPTVSGVERRLRVHWSQNGHECTLVNEHDEGMLLARCASHGSKYEIFLIKDGDQLKEQDPSFVLESNSSKSEWTLHAVRCDRCEEHGKRTCGRRELGRIAQYCEIVGDGEAFCLDLDIPAVKDDGTSAVFCSVCGDSASSSAVKYLTSRRPQWNPKRKSLTLDFHGRATMPSAKNFMLCDPEKPGKTKFLFGRVGESQYVLDYRSPLGTIQAFAAALSASHWS